jgi:hypothetical protein
MKMAVQWRQNATANTNRDTRAQGNGVRELRPLSRNTDASESRQKEGRKEAAAEAEQGQGLAFSLSAPLAFRSLSLLAFPGQSIPREATASNLRTDVREAFRVSQFTVVVPERLFVQVAEQMERLHADVRAVQLPFYQTPEIFHRVRVDVSTCVLYGVIHNGVLVVASQSIVGFQRVTEERRASLYVLTNLAMEFMLPPVRNGKGADVSAALYHSKGDSFVFPARTGDYLRSALRVHIAGLATDERFVNLDFTLQLGCGFVLHGFTNPMEHEPRRLLSQSEITGDLATANTIPAVGNQPHGGKPLVETDGRFIQYRSNLNGELFPARGRFALPDTAGLEEHRFLGPAVGALRSVRPTLRREVPERVVGISEVNNRFSQCLRGVHE